MRKLYSVAVIQALGSIERHGAPASLIPFRGCIGAGSRRRRTQRCLRRRRRWWRPGASLRTPMWTGASAGTTGRRSSATRWWRPTAPSLATTHMPRSGTCWTSWATPSLALCLPRAHSSCVAHPSRASTCMVLEKRVQAASHIPAVQCQMSDFVRRPARLSHSKPDLLSCCALMSQEPLLYHFLQQHA